MKFIVSDVSLLVSCDAELTAFYEAMFDRGAEHPTRTTRAASDREASRHLLPDDDQCLRYEETVLRPLHHMQTCLAFGERSMS